MRTDILNDICVIISELKSKETTVTENTVPGDVDGWDSLFQANLTAALESKYGIRFKIREILSWEKVGDIINSIENHQ